MQQDVRFPGRRFSVSAIPPGGGDGMHACSAAGLDVAQIIPHVPALAGGELQSGGRLQQRGWVRLGMCCGITGNDATCMAQPYLRNERLGESRRLIGNNAPGKAAGFKLDQ